MVRIIVFLILLPSNSIAKDYLFDEMVKSWSAENECESETTESDNSEDIPDDYDSGSDSWDNLYLDPYEDTEIIY
jgi:hypothetical protein